MSEVTAILSMLHEKEESHSATRLFRGKPVLEWTLRRLSRAKRIDSVAVLCWEDQLPRVAGVADDAGAYVLAKGPRIRIAEVEAVAAARRWSDGWRGGLLGTCAFDRGFYGPWFSELAEKLQSEAVILIDPSSALVDPSMADELVNHAVAHPEQEICFAPAAPGLGGAILRLSLLQRLAATRVHAGRLLHYLPDHLSREMIGTDACLPVPTPVARTVHRFTLDSERQIARIQHATECLNGQLIGAGAEELVRRVQSAAWSDRVPRELVVELGTARRSNPIFLPKREATLNRPDMTVQIARRIFDELSAYDDTRITFAGLGDPLANESFFEILGLAEAAGMQAIHVETDLLANEPAFLERLATSPIDVISVHLPAASEGTYQAIMGVDGFKSVIDQIRVFLTARQKSGGAVPLIVPVFTKCRQNMAEMERWYDQWLAALNSAVIRSPTSFGGMIEGIAVAEMAPPGRRACARLDSRMTILSDRRIVTCEEDLLGRQSLGKVGEVPIAEAWQSGMSAVRTDHQQLRWHKHSLCATCQEWHRP